MTQLGELVEAVPVVLGFHPARSLTMILIKGTRAVLTVRIDLPEATESAQRYADHLVGTLTARANVDADRAALIVVDQQRHEAVVSRVADALTRAGITGRPDGVGRGHPVRAALGVSRRVSPRRRARDHAPGGGLRNGRAGCAAQP
jgi:hypothetical protein